MTREEIKKSIEEIDDEVLLTIIDCCKELVCNRTQMFLWDRDAIMDVLDGVMKGNGL